MNDAAYRSSYRVESRVRELTADEAALVQTRVREWNDQLRRREMRRVRELVYALPFAVGLVILAARSGWDGMVFTAGMMCVLFALLAFVARRQALRKIAASRSPWHAPEGGWKIRETRVVARSIVIVPGDLDAMWVLFEIPGGDWFYVDATALPKGFDHLARADVRLTRLSPDGTYVEVVSSGDAIPSRRMMAWKPPGSDAVGTIAESALPPAFSRPASTP